ncbi:MAG: Flp pilus assembly complex ATPase component TadA, partial [Chitinivibrionales bacterium]|nr:Flp pilus assembly complex ATPase component TadA [Chitinivibrionales bacterium]
MLEPVQQKKAKPLGERLIEAGIISQAHLSLALSEQRRNGGLLGEILEKLGFVSQTDISKILATDMQTEYVDVVHTVIDPDVLKLVPLEFSKRHFLIPFNREKDVLTVAMANTFDVMAVDAIEKMTGLRVEVVAASAQAIQEAVEQKYVHTNTLDQLIDLILNSDPEQLDDETGSTAPVVQLVDQLITLAVRKRTTDIHLEPEEAVVRVRFRIDGVLHQEILFPKALQLVVTARMKIMAGIDVTEHRLPQDGRIAFQIGRKQLDLRVSSLPTQFGESMVLRVLDKSNTTLNLDGLGVDKREKMVLTKAIEMPHGIILVTGPTGSGKTTTLYAALGQMDALHHSIFTLEDPVEYRLPMIRQTQINAEIGMSFAGGLRALLRQDPDIILVGEIRDEETAQLAIRAALTGHLVLSTLHTNSAAGAVPRLINMGVEPYLISSTLIAVIAQRLVRRICPYCITESPDVEQHAMKMGFEPWPND